MNILFKNNSGLELVKIIRSEKELSDKAFEEIYNRYSRQVRAFCINILKDEMSAQDFSQETFIRFYQNIRVQEDRVSVLSYLLKTAKNLSLNHINKFERITYSASLDLYEC